MTTAVNVLLFALILLRLLIGVQLFFSARRNRLPNLYWLSAVFILNFIGLLFAPTEGNPLAALPFAMWMFNGFVLFAGLTLINFIHTTFYANQASPRRWFLGAHLLLCVIGFYGLTISQSSFNVSGLVASFSVSNSMLWVWHTYAAYQAYRSIAANGAVEDWVKARYRLMIGFAVIIVIATTSNTLRTAFTGGGVNLALGNLFAIVTLISNLASVTLQFLVWVMPEAFRQWLNRDQKLHDEERTSKRALAILQMLGTAMSTGTGLNEMLAMFALRAAVAKTIQSEDSVRIEAHMAALGYEEWRALLETPHLRQLCVNAAANVTVDNVLANAQKALTDKQSLFTMQAR